MSDKIKAYAANSQGEKLQPIEYDPGPLRDEQVEIKVSHCGLCHSDLSMLNNDWGRTFFPFVPGHEVAGTITAMGARAQGLKIGQRVGLGWVSESCMACPQCLAGDQNLCADKEETIIKRFGGFAERVRCHWMWAIPLPQKMETAKAGPLFCGGITVFNPLPQFGVKPTDHVGVIGIGGLGHMALQFLNKWGCQVYAFTSSDSKREEAMNLGAHQVVNSKDPQQIRRIAGSLDFIISTVNVPLDWAAIIGTLKPKGRLHFSGAVVAPLDIPPAFLIGGQTSLSASPVGGPLATAKMLEFCARHDIAPVTENFPMSRINDAFDHLRSGKARYRIVLENDFK